MEVVGTARSGTPPNGSRRGDEGGLAYVPGLDGIRALAVLAVFAYHLGGDHLVGGFLGVDVFFVLSGYLITGLLLSEAGRTGRIGLRRFYLRRARRLLPALYAMMVATGLVVAAWLPQQAERMRGSLLASLAYVNNWWLIHENASYFGTGDRPDLLTHLWSLAVEEQFYLVWPAVMILLVARRHSRRWMIGVLICAIGASTIAAVVLYNPWADPSRVYYGTDTRAAAPLIGALVAVLLRPWRRRPTVRWLDAVGLTSLIALGVVAWRVSDRDSRLYEGGFLVVAVLAAAVVAAAGQPGSRLGTLLGAGPLRWLGQRSYAFYLWHWPVIALTRPGIDIELVGWANLGLRLALTLVLAETSYWLVERPVRSGSLFRLASRPGPRLVTAALVVVTLAGGTIVGWRLTHVAAARPVDAAAEAPVADPGTLPVLPSPTGPLKQATLRPLPMKVAIFGDSQGTALYANRPRNTSSYLRLSDQSLSACGILRGRVVSRSGERHDLVSACPNWEDEWRADAKRVKPDIALVVIGAWDVFDLRTRTQTLTFGTAPWDAEFLATLRRGIAALRKSGAQVALAELPCYRPKKSNPRPPGYWPERGDDSRTRHVNDLLRQAADGVHVFTVTPPASFCEEPTVADNHKNRYDGVHYLGPGAALYFKAIIPQLRELPR